MAIPRSRHARAFYRCADKRRVEAAILIKADQPTGAVYLGGYVAEFMLEVDPVDAERFLQAVDAVYEWADGRI